MPGLGAAELYSIVEGSMIAASAAMPDGAAMSDAQFFVLCVD